MRAWLLLSLLSAALPAVGAEGLVSVDWLARHYGDGDLRVIHVGRDRTVYDAGHLPLAVFLPYAAIAGERDGNENELPPAAALTTVFENLGVGETDQLVIYGEGAGLMAARVFVTLTYLGRRRSACLDGGLEAWRAAGQATTTVPYEPAARPFRPRLRPEVVVAKTAVADASWALGHLPEPGLRLLDARPAEQFAGTTPGPGISRPGHIPGAANIYWVDLLESPELPRLKPVEQVREIFAAAGARTGETIITYCRTGGQASYLFLVAAALGYDVRLYDGSYSEWSRDPALPVVGPDQPFVQGDHREPFAPDLAPRPPRGPGPPGTQRLWLEGPPDQRRGPRPGAGGLGPRGGYRRGAPAFPPDRH